MIFGNQDEVLEMIPRSGDTPNRNGEKKILGLKERLEQMQLSRAPREKHMEIAPGDNCPRKLISGDICPMDGIDEMSPKIEGHKSPYDMGI